jgi:hypothetical protein
LEQVGVSNYQDILLPQCLWLADSGSNLLGIHLPGLTGYMFDRHPPVFTRGLLLFHGWLPMLLVCYFFTPPAGAHLANPNLPININYIYGFNDQQPQHWVNQNLYVILWLGVLWLVAFSPTHLALRKIFTAPPPAAGLKLRFL